MCAAAPIQIFRGVGGVQEVSTVSKCQRDSKVMQGWYLHVFGLTAVFLSHLSPISHLSDTARESEVPIQHKSIFHAVYCTLQYHGSDLVTMSLYCYVFSLYCIISADLKSSYNFIILRTSHPR